ncbi:Hexuronate transporter [Roseovarius albus]|uniref:Hexuronate transporter n=1 Tax=Roseovarius albus TaxID=1247867 RepID=A0A1X6Z881_9RHOB|nr:MFS transporter [Roseovarius albus]SLN43020.1 Hexuronate transporter [Roseovarius albus]
MKPSSSSFLSVSVTDAAVILHPAKVIPAGIAIVGVTYGLARYAYGLFLPYMQEDLMLSTEVSGLIAGISYFGYLAATLIGAGVSARFGARLPVVIGGLAAAIGMGCIATASSAWALGVGVFIAGASPGLAYPPLSKIILRHVEETHREKSYAWINSGTGFGVLLAGPVALFAGVDWRLAWGIFASLALLATFWNLSLLPKPQNSQAGAQRAFSFSAALRRNAFGLFAVAFLFGLVTSVYWTFAVDLLVRGNGWSSENAAMFWIVVGVAGILGCFAGHLVQVIGVKICFVIGALILASAFLMLPMAPHIPALVFLSAAIFGATFIGITALFGIASIYLYNDQPEIGFGIVFFLISLGQLVGPIGGGFAIVSFGISNVFLVTAACCSLLAIMAPIENIKSMTDRGA